jgi:hypothetical protein
MECLRHLEWGNNQIVNSDGFRADSTVVMLEIILTDPRNAAFRRGEANGQGDWTISYI